VYRCDNYKHFKILSSLTKMGKYEEIRYRRDINDKISLYSNIMKPKYYAQNFDRNVISRNDTAFICKYLLNIIETLFFLSHRFVFKSINNASLNSLLSMPNESLHVFA
jgi:hypothetical protein